MIIGLKQNSILQNNFLNDLKRRIKEKNYFFSIRNFRRDLENKWTTLIVENDFPTPGYRSPSLPDVGNLSAI